MWDFNAHYNSWFTRLREDVRIIRLAGQIHESNLAAINKHSPFRVTPRWHESVTLLTLNTWKTVCTFGSDHFPFVVIIKTPNEFFVPDKNTYINCNRANWANVFHGPHGGFIKETFLSNLLEDQSIQIWPTATVRLIKQRNELRTTNNK